jgi:hypothetical protein
VGAVAFAAYWHWLRPWHVRWGATEAEVRRALPGDELAPNPKLSATHVITIHAPVAQVWPWLAQIGQGRGGFYSYTWIGNLLGCDIHNADRIHPEWQNLKAGDPIFLHPKIPPIPAVIVEPGRVIVLHGDSRQGPPIKLLKPGDYVAATWTFYLEPVDERTTRLIERFHSDYNSSRVNTFFNLVILEPGSFIMERRMLLGIKERAEGGARGQKRDGLAQGGIS